MIRLLVWCAGTAGWAWLIWRFHFWHELLAVGVVTLAAMWTLGGAFVVSRSSGRDRRAGPSAPHGGSILKDSIEMAERARREREAAK